MKTASANTPIADAARTMREKRVKRLVVVDADGCVEGVFQGFEFVFIR